MSNVRIDSAFGLAEALGVRKGDVVSLVGAGGKTTVLYGIASELRRSGMTVVATTTTRMQTPRHPTTMPPLVYAAMEDNWLETVRARIERYGSATVLAAEVRQDKLQGLEPDQIALLRTVADCVIVEADGARGRSLKAPAGHEPVIPPSTSLTVILAGLDALGMPLDENSVHRLEVVLRLSGARPGSAITEEVIVATLTKGYQPAVPTGTRWACFLNKVDDSRLKSAEAVGNQLLTAGVPEVVFGQASRANECFYRMRRLPD